MGMSVKLRGGELRENCEPDSSSPPARSQPTRALPQILRRARRERDALGLILRRAAFLGRSLKSLRIACANFVFGSPPLALLSMCVRSHLECTWRFSCRERLANATEFSITSNARCPRRGLFFLKISQRASVILPSADLVVPTHSRIAASQSASSDINNVN